MCLCATWEKIEVGTLWPCLQQQGQVRKKRQNDTSFKCNIRIRAAILVMPFVLGAAIEDKPLQLMISKPWCTLLTSLLLQFWSITYRPTSFNFIDLLFDPAVHAGDMSRFARSCEMCKNMETLSDQWKAVKEGSRKDPSLKCRAGRKWTLGLLHKMVLPKSTTVTPLREPTALADALHECIAFTKLTRLENQSVDMEKSWLV